MDENTVRLLALFLIEALVVAVVTAVILRWRARRASGATESGSHAPVGNSWEFLDAGLEAIHIVDPDLRIVAINRLAVTRLALHSAGFRDKEEVLGRDLFEVYPFLAQDGLAQRMRSVLVDGRTIRWDVSTPLAAGGEQHFQMHVFRYGGLLGVVSIDRTESRRSELALQESQRELSTLMSNLPGMAYHCLNDPNWTMLFVSDGCRPLTGYEADELVGSEYPAYADLIVEEDRPMVWDGVQEGLRRSAPFRLTYRIRDKAGAEKWVWEQGRGVFGADGELVAIEGFISDITDAKHAEQESARLQEQLIQSRKMESVGRLAGGVAHDFNNMLGVILGHAELAADHLEADHPARGDLKQITGAAKRSADLTAQLLAFARKQAIAPKVVDLNEAITDTGRLIRRLIGEGVTLNWRPGAGLWPVHMDPAQIDQILINLCVNARDAMDGEGKITIETGNQDVDREFFDSSTHETVHAAAGQYVMIAVSDDGRGMDPETMSRIFEPFYTTKGGEEGTGLGLSMIYGIVKQNGGFIHTYSEPGVGTAFKIYLPRHEGVPEESPAAARSGVRPGQGETILLVEDEISLLAMVRSMLERLDYRVLAAETPAEALEAAHRHSGDIDLLITDVVMPLMNGRELAERLTASRPGLRTLYMSGYTSNVIANSGVLDQDIDFLGKPFSLQALAEMVGGILDRDGRQDPESGNPTATPAPAPRSARSPRPES